MRGDDLIDVVIAAWRTRALRAVVTVLAAVYALVPVRATLACSPGPPVVTLTPDAAAPGQSIAVAGTGFLADGSTVTVRFDGLSGPVLWSGVPDGSGRLGFSFVAPATPTGFDYLTAYGGASQGMGPTHAALRLHPAPSPVGGAARRTSTSLPSAHVAVVGADRSASTHPVMAILFGTGVLVLLLAIAAVCLSARTTGKRARRAEPRRGLHTQGSEPAPDTSSLELVTVRVIALPIEAPTEGHGFEVSGAVAAAEPA